MHLVREHFCVVCGACNKADHGRCFACGHSLKTTQPLPSVTSLSLLNRRYHLLEQVGQGGFSVVYKAEDTQTKQVVAIKATSLRELGSQEKIEATDTFNREVGLLSQVSHDHLPRIYDHFSDSECWYLVMEFIHGITLETQLERYGKTSLSLEEVLDLGLQLCDVLAYLHSRQPAIIFRDLKPANIILSKDGKLFLIDFGIARRFMPGKAKDTIPFGSPGYAAPEQYGRTQTDIRSDIYSLGAILHQLISGDDPAQNPFTFVPLPGQDRSELRQLDRLIQQMVSLGSDQRPECLQMVKQELEPIARQHRLLRTNPLSPPIYPSSKSTQIQAQAKLTLPQTQSPCGKAFLTRDASMLISLLIVLVGISLFSVTITHPPHQAEKTTLHRFHPRAVAPYTSMFGVDAAQTRFNQDEHTLNIHNVGQLRTVWTDSNAGHTPAVANGIVYTSSDDAKLYALDAETGQQIWAVSLPWGASSSPAVVNGIVYVASCDNKLYAFDAQTGQVKWMDLTGGITGYMLESSPTVANGIVYVGSYDHKLYAFDAQTGQVKWTDLTGDMLESSPAVANGMVYVTDYTELYAFDAATGKQRWSIPVPNGLSVAVAKGIIYMSTTYGKLYAFDAKTGQQKWVAHINFTGISPEWVSKDFFSSPAVANGAVYVSTTYGKFLAFDAQTGQQKWNTSVEMGLIHSPPTIANGLIYVDVENNLYVLNAATGQQIQAIQIEGQLSGASPPVVANGMVYVSVNTQAGTQAWLYAFGAAHK